MSLSPDQRHVLLLADRTRDIGQITAAVARRILESRQLFAILKTCRIVSARWLGLVQPVSSHGVFEAGEFRHGASI
jgi:hypothetical protein